MFIRIRRIQEYSNLSSMNKFVYIPIPIRKLNSICLQDTYPQSASLQTSLTTANIFTDRLAVLTGFNISVGEIQK